MRRFILVLLVLLLVCAHARADKDVDLALVLLTDVSRSIDDAEFKMEKDGYASAFTNSKVIAAIRGGALGRIAVTYVEFAGTAEVRTVIDWTVVHDSDSARAFVDQVSAAPRSFSGRTAIGAGIDHAVQSLVESGFAATRSVIDVCADGANNAGRESSAARDDAMKAGITINGLAIINENPASWTFAHVHPPGGLPNYFRENIIGGPGSFVLEIRDFSMFADAMTRKLILEIASTGGPTRWVAMP